MSYIIIYNFCVEKKFVYVEEIKEQIRLKKKVVKKQKLIRRIKNFPGFKKMAFSKQRW